MSISQWLTLFISFLATISQACQYQSALPNPFQTSEISTSKAVVNGIPFSTRAHWIRVANQAPIELISTCPFAPFGAAIVNHTSNNDIGELICIGANNNSAIGNPTLHGEIAAINNCTRMLTDPDGKYRLTPSSALAGWQDLTIYTNAESCPMCASAIRWAGFKEYIYGTSIDFLVAKGWDQIKISSHELFARSQHLPTSTSFLAGVLQNETDPYFSWQFSTTSPCPTGCVRNQNSECSPTQNE